MFAHVLKARLRHGVVERVGGSFYRVTGLLNAPAVLARVEIKIPLNFDIVIGRPPRAWCHEPWMRSAADWHNDTTRGMCWVLENEWCDILSRPGRLPRDLVSAGTAWLLNNVQSLVSRHHYANLVGIKAWPKEWDAWPHYDKGAEQYERTKCSQADRTS